MSKPQMTPRQEAQSIMMIPNANRLILIPLLILCYLWQGCGLINDQSPDGEMADLENFETVCPVDAEALQKILDQDVSYQIDCLEKNLESFAKFVRRQNQDEIKLEELEIFILRFMNVEAKLIKDILFLVFQVNSLFLRDKPDSLKVSNLRSFMDLIRIINVHGSKLKVVFEQIKEKGYFENRNEMITYLTRQSAEMFDLIKDRPDNGHLVETIPFLDDVKKAVEIPDENLNLDMIDSLLFFKRLFIGGERSKITAIDIEEIIKKIPELIKIYFDFVDVKRHHFNSEWEYYKFQLANIHVLEEMLTDGVKSEVIIDHDQLMNLLQRFLVQYNWKNISDSIKLFKKDIVGGNSHYYTLEDVRTIIGYGREVFESLFFFTHTYELLKEEMEKDQPITNLTFPDTDEFSIIPGSRLIALWDEFLKVATQYRVFPQENGLTLFSYKYQRTSYGFLLQSILRYGGNKLFETYRSHRTPGGRWSIDKPNIRKVIVGYKGALEEFNMWPQDLDRLVRELMLGSDLFQFSSNGDGLLQMVEVAQYLPTIIGANIMGKEIFSKMETYCDHSTTLFNYDVTCYRENFFPTLFYDMNKKILFPNFYNYFKRAPWSDTIQYLADAEQMARIDPDPAVPVTKTDLCRLITSMSNTESLFLRFDHDQDGVIDRKELDGVFDILKTVLSEEANLKPDSKLLKSVFLYVIKNKRHPKVVELLLFHVFGKKKDIYADRNTVAAVLKMFGPKKDSENTSVGGNP